MPSKYNSPPAILTRGKLRLTAPFETAEGEQLPRRRGTPQGGAVSPILMNLFMHYAFDIWLKRTHPQIVYCKDSNRTQLYPHVKYFQPAATAPTTATICAGK
jgi:retron-type reverse transcriptase